MSSIPREIFDLILLSFASYTSPSTERYPELTPESKQGILNARLAWPNLRQEYPFKELFVSVMTEALFIIPTGYSYPPFPEELEAFSLLPYAEYVTTLSFRPPMNPAWQHSNIPRVNPLIRILQRFRRLREVRYYALPRTYLHGPWVPARNGDLLLQSETTFPYGPSGFRSWAFLETHHQINEQLGTYLNELVSCLTSSHQRNITSNTAPEKPAPPISTFRMPLIGNMSSFAATISSDLFRRQPQFAKHLLCIEINLLLKEPSVFDLSPPVIGPWIYACEMLQYLDIAVTRAGRRADPRAAVYTVQRVGSGAALRLLAPGEEPLGGKLPTGLRELRIMAKPGVLFSGSSVMDFVTGLTPGLKKVCFAHLAVSGEWGGLLRGLGQAGVERVCLINPVQRVDTRRGVVVEGYFGGDWGREGEGEEKLSVDVRHVEYPWDEGENGSEARWRGHRYPGFGCAEE